MESNIDASSCGDASVMKQAVGSSAVFVAEPLNIVKGSDKCRLSSHDSEKVLACKVAGKDEKSCRDNMVALLKNDAVPSVASQAMLSNQIEEIFHNKRVAEECCSGNAAETFCSVGPSQEHTKKGCIQKAGTEEISHSSSPAEPGTILKFQEKSNDLVEDAAFGHRGKVSEHFLENEETTDAMGSANPSICLQLQSSDSVKDDVAGKGRSVIHVVQEEPGDGSAKAHDDGISLSLENSSGAQASEEQPNSRSDNGNSEEIEEDVKVCDICGDEGQEDLLAICTRCNDGAEHTYCMREMLEELPDSEWLCEECRFEEDLRKGKKKHQQSAGLSSVLLKEGKKEQHVSTGNAKGSQKEVDGMILEMKAVTKTSQVNVVSKNDDVLEPMRAKVSEQCDGKTDDIGTKKGTLHCEESVKLNVEKGRQQSQTADLSKSCSAAVSGLLLKSASFKSSKVPKVKALTDDIPQMVAKGMKELSNNEKKDGSSDTVTKSASFKRASDIGDKKKSDGIPHNEVKSTGDRELVNSKHSSTIGRSIANSSATGGTSGRSVLAAGKSKPASTATNLGLNQGLEFGKSIGPKEMKKPLISILPLDIIANGNSASYNNSVGNTQRRPHHSSGIVPQLRSLSERYQNADIDRSGSHRNALEGTFAMGPRSLDQCKPSMTSGSDLSYATKIKDGLSTSENSGRKSIVMDALATGQEMMRTETRYGVCNSRKIPELTYQIEKPQSLSCPINLTISTIPQLQYIWQGSFEIWRTGRTREICQGFQAHLSSSASHKVQVAMASFPCNVRLEEVPRKNLWSPQVLENGSGEYNIAVFFFARDFESYESHYSKLVESMVRKDLVLRGTVVGVELLICPSSLLPKSFQKWNGLYFLWGVFRVKQVDSVEPVSHPIAQQCKAGLNSVDAPNELQTVTSIGACTEVKQDVENEGMEIVPNRISQGDESKETSSHDFFDMETTTTEVLHVNQESGIDRSKTSSLSGKRKNFNLEHENCSLEEAKSWEDTDAREENKRMKLDNGAQAEEVCAREETIDAEFLPEVNPSTGDSSISKTSSVDLPCSEQMLSSVNLGDNISSTPLASIPSDKDAELLECNTMDVELDCKEKNEQQEKSSSTYVSPNIEQKIKDYPLTSRSQRDGSDLAGPPLLSLLAPAAERREQVNSDRLEPE